MHFFRNDKLRDGGNSGGRMVTDYYAMLGVDPGADSAAVEAALSRNQPIWVQSVWLQKGDFHNSVSGKVFRRLRSGICLR